METTRFQVYKINKKGIKYFFVLCTVIAILGLLGIIVLMLSENPKFLKLEISSYFFLLLQGVVGIVISVKNFNSEKYFFSWDDYEIQYQLPKDKEPVLIRVEDIQSVEKTNRDFRITLKNNEIKNFSFNYFYFPTRQTIFDFFESLKNKAEIINMSK